MFMCTMQLDDTIKYLFTYMRIENAMLYALYVVSLYVI